MGFITIVLEYMELEIRDGGASGSLSTVQNCFSFPGFFVFPYEVECCSFKVCKELCWDFNGGIVLNL